MSKHTTVDMRWYKEKRIDIDGVLRHPADAEGWKDFDQKHRWFAQEPQNVRLGLATDGFNPFGNMNNSYSMWPILVFPYNLPLWKCMKEPFLMMSLLIPGPKAPRKDIDVYLRPLVEELKELWDVGVQTYDVSKEQYFRMHVAVLWTVNEFLAYGDLFGWSTKGYKACPVCNKDTKSKKLINKICYMGHCRYLRVGHSWRNSREFDSEPEHGSPPRMFRGDDILCQLQQLPHTKFGKNENNLDMKRKRSPNELNWTTKSIFFFSFLIGRV